MTSFTKPEIHITYSNAVRGGPSNPRPQATCTKNLVKFGRVVFELFERADRQTDRRTDRHTQTQTNKRTNIFITILRTHPDGQVISRNL